MEYRCYLKNKHSNVMERIQWQYYWELKHVAMHFSCRCKFSLCILPSFYQIGRFGFYTLLKQISMYCWSRFLCITGAHLYTLFKQLSAHFYTILHIIGAHLYALLEHTSASNKACFYDFLSAIRFLCLIKHGFMPFLQL